MGKEQNKKFSPKALPVPGRPRADPPPVQGLRTPQGLERPVQGLPSALRLRLEERTPHPSTPLGVTLSLSPIRLTQGDPELVEGSKGQGLERRVEKIGIIFGGRSSEKEVSLAGGRHVYYHLDRIKFIPIPIYWDSEAKFWQIPESLVIRNTCKEIEEHLEEKGAERIPYDNLKGKIDLAFLVTHGKYGDDGCLQGLLEILGIPYTGSGILSAALGMDKSMQREFMKLDPKISLPEYLVIDKEDWDKEREKTIEETETKFNYPIVSKPTREGSTIGVALIRSRDYFEDGIKKALEYDNNILLEKYIKGREFSCIVFGNEDSVAFLPTETIYGDDIFTYDHKYLPGASQKITPIKIDQKIIEEIQEQSVRTYRILNCRGYARIDGFIEEGKWVLITDPNSAASTGMGPSSWTYHQAALAGLDVPHFLTKIIEMAIEAHRNKKGAL